MNEEEEPQYCRICGKKLSEAEKVICNGLCSVCYFLEYGEW